MSVTRITCVLSLFKDLVHLVCLCDVFYKAPFTCCDDLCGLTCLCQSIDMTAAITPLALNRHSSCFWLTDFVYKTLRNFRLLSRCPTRRGCRGYRTRRRWGNSLYSNLALINARSINSKSELINDFISSSSIDVLLSLSHGSVGTMVTMILELYVLPATLLCTIFEGVEVAALLLYSTA